MKENISKSNAYSVTGYFHVHIFGLTPEQRQAYTQALKKHHALAYEGLGHTPKDNEEIKRVVKTGESSHTFRPSTDQIERDSNLRVRLAARSPINDAYYIDIPYRKSRREIKKFKNFSSRMEDVVALVIGGSINTEDLYKAALSEWDNLCAQEAAFHEKREQYMIDVLRNKLHKSSPERKVLWPIGALHVIGLKKLLKNDEHIKLDAVMEKPLVFGFVLGATIMHRLKKEKPSEELLAKGLLELAIRFIIQQTVPIHTKEEYYSHMKFAKNFVACLSADEIKELIVAKRERTIFDFIDLLSEKLQDIQNHKERRQIPQTHTSDMKDLLLSA